MSHWNLKRAGETVTREAFDLDPLFAAPGSIGRACSLLEMVAVENARRVRFGLGQQRLPS
jgi:hypothetical protein